MRLLQTPTPGDRACDPGVCPERESNQLATFRAQDGAHTAEPHQPGLRSHFQLSDT